MANPITDNIHIWSTAQIPKASSGKGNGNGSAQNAYGIKKLRELILELAVRGKLVPQDPNDEPASMLLEKIAKEKARLIKEGKIKKQESLPEIDEGKERFEVPDSWEWARVGQIAQHNSGKTLDSVRNAGPLREYITTSNLYWGYFNLDELKQMPISDEELDRCTAKKGDLLICEGGEAGRAAVWEFAHNVCFQNHIHRVRLFCNIDPSYVYRVFLKMSYTGEIDSYRKGVGISNMSGKTLAAIPIPLPPLVEQHRIVAKVDELMALCDQLERQQDESTAAHQTLVQTLLNILTDAADQEEAAEAWNLLCEHFDTLFTTEYSTDQLKQTILQLAVMGKLVPQDPNDEPASVLLEKIAKEKTRLIKEGKIKKQDPLPEITDDEKPFELPDGWGWARFPEIGQFGRGRSKHRPRNDPSLYSHGKYPMVQTGDVARANGVVETYTALYNDRGVSQSRMWPKGTMCITIAANIADSSILGFDACFPDSVVGLIPSPEFNDAKYFEYFMRTAKERLADFAPSTAQKNINLGILETVYIPLPPADEIKRIVAKIDELMALCDTLKSRISDSQTTQVHLADAIVEQATG